MATDREILKNQQAGALGTAPGVSDAKDTIRKFHEETFLLANDADASLVERGFRVQKAFRVKSCYYIPSTGLAASDSAYDTLTVSKRDGAGGSASVVATRTTQVTGGAALVAFVPFELTLSATTAYHYFAVGEVLTVLITETSTPTTPFGVFSVTVEYI